MLKQFLINVLYVSVFKLSNYFREVIIRLYIFHLKQVFESKYCVIQTVHLELKILLHSRKDLVYSFLNELCPVL